MRWTLVVVLAGCDFSASDSIPPGSHPGQPDADVTVAPDAPGTTGVVSPS